MVCLVGCRSVACVSFVLVNLNIFASDIDHLTRILFLCGKPEQETIDKIISEEVRQITLVLLIL